MPLRVSTTSLDPAEEELDVVGVLSSSSIEVGVEGDWARLLLVFLLLLLVSLPRRRCRIIWFCVIFMVFRAFLWSASREEEEKKQKQKAEVEVEV